MKHLPRLAIFVSSLLIFSFSTMVSCKKEKIVDRVVNDTVYVSTDVPITATLMSENKWMIEEARGVSGGSIFYYLRGGSANTTNVFDNEHIKFNTDNTGTYQDFGATRTIAWHFINADNSKLVINFTNTPANFDVTWDNIHSKNGKIYFDEYFTDGNTGANSHGQFTRIPKP